MRDGVSYPYTRCRNNTTGTAISHIIDKVHYYIFIIYRLLELTPRAMQFLVDELVTKGILGKTKGDPRTWATRAANESSLSKEHYLSTGGLTLSHNDTVTSGPVHGRRTNPRLRDRTHSKTTPTVLTCSHTGDMAMSTRSSEELAVVVGTTGAFSTTIVSRPLSAGLRVVAVSRSASTLRELLARYEVISCVADISTDASNQAISAAGTGPVRMIVHGPGLAVAVGVLTAPTHAMADAVDIKVGGMLRLVRAIDGQLQTREARRYRRPLWARTERSCDGGGIANAALVNLMRQLSLVYG